MRAIDADKLKEVLEKNFGHTGGASVLAQLIDAQDTIQPESHWHPVSEQPKEDDDYLLLTHEKFKYGRFSRIIIGAWDGGEKVWLEEYEGMYRGVNHPVAWMSKEELLLLKGYEVTE